MTEDNGDHLFVPIPAKWQASATDDDDDECIIHEVSTHVIDPGHRWLLCLDPT